MKLLQLFTRQKSASVARDRLQILLAHERTYSGQSDLVAALRDEIIAVLAKHVKVAEDQVQIRMERGDQMSTLEVEIEIPTPARKRGSPEGSPSPPTPLIHRCSTQQTRLPGPASPSRSSGAGTR